MTLLEIALDEMAVAEADEGRRQAVGAAELFPERNGAEACVNALIEMTDMREAQRSYEANLRAIEVARTMLQRTIDLIR